MEPAANISSTIKDFKEKDYIKTIAGTLAADSHGADIDALAVDALVAKIEKKLDERNEKLALTPVEGETPLNSDQKAYAIAAIRDLLVQELAANFPSQQSLIEARERAAAEFTVRGKICLSLDNMSIEAIVAFVFHERIDVLSKYVRAQAQELAQRNTQMEAIGNLKTLFAGHQPTQGETTLKEVTVASSHAEIIKLQLAAKMAQFNLQPHLDKRDDSQAKIIDQVVLPYAVYQQINTALAGHTDKYTNLVTSQQFMLTERKKQLDQCWEFLSTFSKRSHDTVQTIIRNMGH